ADDCHFNHYIVKTFRLHPRQGRHLRTALDLKNADRVGLLHDLKRGSVILWNMSKIERAPALTAQFKRILHHRHHPEPEQIDLHDTKVFAIVLVPLRNDPSRHGRIFQRQKGAEFVLTECWGGGFFFLGVVGGGGGGVGGGGGGGGGGRFWQT